jgi:hypothetical protein
MEWPISCESPVYSVPTLAVDPNDCPDDRQFPARSTSARDTLLGIPLSVVASCHTAERRGSSHAGQTRPAQRAQVPVEGGLKACTRRVDNMWCVHIDTVEILEWSITSTYIPPLHCTGVTYLIQSCFVSDLQIQVADLAAFNQSKYYCA